MLESFRPCSPLPGHIVSCLMFREQHIEVIVPSSRPPYFSWRTCFWSYGQLTEDESTDELSFSCVCQLDKGMIHPLSTTIATVLPLWFVSCGHCAIRVSVTICRITRKIIMLRPFISHYNCYICGWVDSVVLIQPLLHSSTSPSPEPLCTPRSCNQRRRNKTLGNTRLQSLHIPLAVWQGQSDRKEFGTCTTYGNWCGRDSDGHGDGQENGGNRELHCVGFGIFKVWMNDENRSW